MRGAARSNLLLRGGGRRAAVLRPSLPQAAPIRIGGPQSNHIFSSSATASSQRPFHASTRALWAISSAEGENGDNASPTEVQTESDAAFEEKERSEAYARWVESVRRELKHIEEMVLKRAPAAADSEEGIEKLEAIFLSNPRMQLSDSLFPDEARSAPSRIITFDKETRRPTQMPYVMLDPKWYQGTTDEERLQQVLAWRPFTARAVAAEKADHQFREDPFRNKSHAFSGRVVSDAFRRQRLDKYLNEELANKRKVYSNVKEEDESHVTLDEMKQAFRANLAMVENISGEEATEEIAEPEVTRDDKYIKPPGFVSATDMLKFSEEKMQSDLDKLMKKAKKCVFCRPSAQRPVLDPMNVSLLTMFLTPTGDIIGRRHNGNCRRHQRKLATTIKRAKHMGIFSYKYGGFTIYSPFLEPVETFAEDDGEGDEEQYGESDEEDDFDDYEDGDEEQQDFH